MGKQGIRGFKITDPQVTILLHARNDVITMAQGSKVTPFSIHKGWRELIQQAAGSIELPLEPQQPHTGDIDDIRDTKKMLVQACEASGDPLFLAKIAQGVQPLTFGCYSLSLWLAPNLATLLKNASDYCAYLSMPLRLHYHQTDTGDAELWLLSSQPFDEETRVSHLGITLYLAVLLKFIHQATSEPVTDIEVQMGQVACSEPVLQQFAAYCQCSITLNHPVRKIRIRAEHLQTPLKHGDSELYLGVLSLLRSQVEQISEQNIVMQVYRVLDSKPSLADLSEKQVASELFVSSRTLNRRLAALGMSYRSLLEKYRFEKALLLMRDPDITMTDIAFRLGFPT